MPNADARRPPWVAAVAFVVGLHTLTAAGTWWITDHGEILAVADRVVTAGRFDLRDLRPGWEDWSRVVAQRPNAETRFAPLAVLSLTPFLAVDLVAGFTHPSEFRFVHAQGLVFVGLSLGLLGRGLVAPAGAGVAAVAVLCAGLSWPVWMIARRIGPEPVLLLLVTAFVSRPRRLGIAALVALPWTHGSGPLISLGCLLLNAATPAVERLPHRAAIAAAGVGVASVGLLWNVPVHGSFVGSGYAAYGTDPFFAGRNPLVGAAEDLLGILPWLLGVLVLGATSRNHRAVLTRSALLAFPVVAFFASFATPEPLRRLSPLVAAWAWIAARERSGAGRRSAATAIVLAMASGVGGLALENVEMLETPFGLYTGPILAFLRWSLADDRPIHAFVLVAIGGAALSLGARGLRSSLSGSLAQHPIVRDTPRP